MFVMDFPILLPWIEKSRRRKIAWALRVYPHLNNERLSKSILSNGEFFYFSSVVPFFSYKRKKIVY